MPVIVSDRIVWIQIKLVIIDIFIQIDNGTGFVKTGYAGSNFPDHG